MTTEVKTAVELLDVDNYATWRSKMKFLLITKGLWTTVEGESTDRDKDAKALAQIGLHVKDHHLPVLETCATAKEAWEQLKTIYQAKSNARKRQLRKELSQLKMGATEPLTKYVARAKEIQNQLRAAGYEVADQEVVWALLAGLPSPYDTVVTVLETSADVDMRLDDILPKLMPVEQRLYAPGVSTREETALLSKTDRECWYCGIKGHLQKNCRKKRQDDARRVHGLKFGAIAL